MEKKELPKGWAKANISQVVSKKGLVSDGDWVESKDQDPDGVVRLIQLADIGDGFFRNRSDRYMNTEVAKKLNCTYLHEGDVLVARMPDPLGRACIFPNINQQAVTVVDICLIRVDSFSAISNKLLMYLINSHCFRNVIAENASGTTRKRITRKKLEKITFNLPPLAEQKEIVRIIESHLQLVDQIKSRLDALPKILEQFRQSVLASAVSGKLTAEWQREKRGNIEVKLEEIISHIRYGTSKKCTDLASGVPVLRIPNIKHGKINLQDLKYAEFSKTELESFSLEVGDILLIRSNGSLDLVGQIGIVDEKSLGCLFAGYLIRIRIDSVKALSSYVGLCLQSPKLRNTIENTARSTSGVNNINSQEVQNLSIPLPIIEEQKEIVKRVENLFALADQIESKIKNAQDRVNLLTQSILAKAFRGEFTAKWREENPDLISGENSAEALLKRIEEAKKAAKKKK